MWEGEGRGWGEGSERRGGEGEKRWRDGKREEWRKEEVMGGREARRMEREKNGDEKVGSGGRRKAPNIKHVGKGAR